MLDGWLQSMVKFDLNLVSSISCAFIVLSHTINVNWVPPTMFLDASASDNKEATKRLFSKCCKT
jgi:hypothetical protein